jgi:hypothetical protein
MNYMRTMLATVGLFVASGAIASAQADDDKRSVTLYTPSLAGNHFTCKAVNVSHKPLRIAFAVLDNKGDPLPSTDPLNQNPFPAVPVAKGTEAEIDFRLPPDKDDDGYCKVDVFGTGDPNDVRVNLDITVIRTPFGPTNTTPVLVVKSQQGH